MFSSFLLAIFTFFAFAATSCPPYDPTAPPVMFPHEWDCTLFYRCEANGPVLMQCWPPGTHFSPYTNRCEWEAVANCTLPGVPPPPTTTRPTTTTTRPTTTTTRPTTTTTTARPTTTTTIPTTTTTTKATTTTTRAATTTTTRIPTTTTRFIPPSASTMTVTTPHTDTTTQQITTETTPEESTATTISQEITTTTGRPSQCPPYDDPKNPIFLPDEEDCSRYFLCFNGTAIKRSCADGLYWDRGNLWCTFANETECFWPDFAAASTMTTTEIADKCPTTDDPTVLVFVASKEECAAYYLCFNGRKVAKRCSEGFHWNTDLSWCDTPENAGCRIRA